MSAVKTVLRVLLTRMRAVQIEFDFIGEKKRKRNEIEIRIIGRTVQG